MDWVKLWIIGVPICFALIMSSAFHAAASERRSLDGNSDAVLLVIAISWPAIVAGLLIVGGLGLLKFGIMALTTAVFRLRGDAE